MDITQALTTVSTAQSRQISPLPDGSSTGREPASALAARIWSRSLWTLSSNVFNPRGDEDD